MLTCVTLKYARWVRDRSTSGSHTWVSPCCLECNINCRLAGFYDFRLLDKLTNVYLNQFILSSSPCSRSDILVSKIMNHQYELGTVQSKNIRLDY